MQKKQGKVITPANRTPWPHEMRAARILARAGHTVEFLPENSLRSADILLDGVTWELKSPDGGNLKVIHRNLMRGKYQSGKIIYSSCRMKRVPDVAIARELRSQAYKISGIAKLKFINRKEEIVDIK